MNDKFNLFLDCATVEDCEDDARACGLDVVDFPRKNPGMPPCVKLTGTKEQFRKFAEYNAMPFSDIEPDLEPVKRPHDKSDVKYVIKNSTGEVVSAPSSDEDYLWDRVTRMENRGHKGLSVVVFNESLTEEKENKMDIKREVYNALSDIVANTKCSERDMDNAYEWFKGHFFSMSSFWEDDHDDSVAESLTEAVEDDLTFKAFITNLGKYNEGDLVGEWVEFPIDEDDFNAVLEKIGINDEYEEWFVTDYECEVGAFDMLGEYPSYEDLNEFGEKLQGVDAEALKNVLEVVSYIDEAIDGLESGDIMFYPGINTEEDLGYVLIDELGGLDNLPGDVYARYFDYEALGRDLSFDEYESDEKDEDGNYIMVDAATYWYGDENASYEDIGIAYIDAVGAEGVSNSEYYFDYEAYGRDCSFDGFTFTSQGCVWVG